MCDPLPWWTSGSPRAKLVDQPWYFCREELEDENRAALRDNPLVMHENAEL